MSLTIENVTNATNANRANARNPYFAALMAGLLAAALLFAGVFGSPEQAFAKPKLNKKSTTLVVSKSKQLKVKGTSKKVKWSTSSKSIATVSKKGLVTAKKAGKAVITAKVGSKKLKCKVTVKHAIEVSKTSLNLDYHSITTLQVISRASHNVFVESSSLSCAYPRWSNKWVGDKTSLIIDNSWPGDAVITIYTKPRSEKVKIKVHADSPNASTGLSAPAWSKVKVIAPETIGAKSHPENRMKVTGYRFENIAWSTEKYSMSVNLTCVQYNDKRWSSWSQDVLFKDAAGNVIGTDDLYAFDLELGSTYSRNIRVPVKTATIVFQGYPEEATDPDPVTPEDTVITALDVKGYANSATKCARNAYSCFANDISKNPTMAPLYYADAAEEVQKCSAWLNKIKTAVNSNPEILDYCDEDFLSKLETAKGYVDEFNATELSENLTANQAWYPQASVAVRLANACLDLYYAIH